MIGHTGGKKLDHQAVWRRKAILRTGMADDERLQASDLETESHAEVEAGFLSGPFAQE